MAGLRFPLSTLQRAHLTPATAWLGVVVIRDVFNVALLHPRLLAGRPGTLTFYWIVPFSLAIGFNSDHPT
jgi:hypothetical protein